MAKKPRDEPYVPPSREDRKMVAIWVPRTTWRTLREMAMDEESSVQALGVEALNLLLKARGKPTIGD